MNESVHLDLTELVARPLRSGIQRIEREAIRHWPGPARLVPCRIDEDGHLLELPGKVLDVLCREHDGGQWAQSKEARTLAMLDIAAKPAKPDQVRRLLNMELFYTPSRADAYLRYSADGMRLLWYIYDFIPFLQPELFPAGVVKDLMHYLRALRAPRHFAFLSEQTRREFAQRVMRRPMGEWPILAPGADGIGLERQVFTTQRRTFVSIGTVENRKNVDSLLRAFMQLWDRGLDARLVICGRVSPDAEFAVAFMRRFSNEPRLTVLDQASDAALRSVLRDARAVVMASEAEGFGLPPYEAVHVGIPAIAWSGLPSVQPLPAGVLRLAHMTPDAIANAVEALLNDAMAEQLWREAAALTLPTWRDFGRSLGDWAQGV